MPTQNPRTADALATWLGPPEAFGLGVRMAGEVTILDLVDSLTWERSAERLKRKITELLDAGARDIAINLGRVSYIDSTGIGSLLTIHNAIQSAGGTCRIFAAQEHIRHTLTRVHLDKVLKLFDDEAAALASH